MKDKVLSLILILMIPSLIFSQCPGTEAINYKNQAQALGPEEFSKKEAYIHLATYYAYKCECEAGSPRATQMVGMINRVVDQYRAYTNSTYGQINKVSTCKEIENQDSENTIENSTDLKNKSEENGTQKFLKDMLNGMGVDQNNLQKLLEGDIEGAFNDMKYNQDVNNLSKNLGDNTALATGLVDAANAIGAQRDQNELEKINSLIIFANSHKIENYGKAKSSIEIGGNFNNADWSILDNSFLKTKIIGDNEIEIEFIDKVTRSSIKNSNQPFLIFENGNFSPKNDFVIEFEIGKFLNNFEDKWYPSAVPFGLFVAEHTKFTVGSLGTYLLSSFTPLKNNFTSDYSVFSEEYKPLKKLIHNRLNLYPEKSLKDVEIYYSSGRKQKYYKKLRKASMSYYKPVHNYLKRIRKNPEDFDDSILYEKYRVFKINDNVQLEHIINIEGQEFISYTLKHPFIYAEGNKIYFGLSGIMGFSYYYGKQGYKYRLKNFKVTQ